MIPTTVHVGPRVATTARANVYTTSETRSPSRPVRVRERWPCNNDCSPPPPAHRFWLGQDVIVDI